jgi:hypothetical protein
VLQLFSSSGQFMLRCYRQLLHCIKRTLSHLRSYNLCKK